MTFSIRVSLAVALIAMIGCDSDNDARVGETVSLLASGGKRAANGNPCTAAGKDDKVTDADCLTIESTWADAGAKPATKQNGDSKLVYTGIDADGDKDLIALEQSFAAGFTTKDKVAQGAVYGAHGCPGRVQGLPDNAAAGGKDTILHETFGGAGIPKLALSVCWAGNTGEDADDGTYKLTPPTYRNNIPTASFITTYFGIASAQIVACKNGVVSPKETTLWCLQTKEKKEDCVKRVVGDATLIKGDGTEYGKATTKDGEKDETGDYVLELQKTPARHFKARNLPTGRTRDKLGEPWSFKSRCNCLGQVNDVQDNYPRFWIETWFGPAPVAPTTCPDTGGGGGSGSGSAAFAFSTGSGSDGGLPPTDGGTGSGSGSGSGSDAGFPDGGSGSGSDAGLPDGGTGSGSGSGSGGGPSSRWYILRGQYLTTQIVIEQPNGVRVPASNASASPDGTYAQFQFTPTQTGVHHVWVTDLDGLRNDPHDPNFMSEQFFEFVMSSP